MRKELHYKFLQRLYPFYVTEVEQKIIKANMNPAEFEWGFIKEKSKGASSFNKMITGKEDFNVFYYKIFAQKDNVVFKSLTYKEESF